MKRILYVELSSGFGGSSAALYSLLKYLDRERFSPVVLVGRMGQNFDKIKDLGIQVVRMKLFGIRPYADCRNRMISYPQYLINLLLDLTVNALKLFFVFTKEKIDIVHINTNIKNHIHVIMAAKWANVPCVFHVRETRPLIKREKFFGRHIHKIIVLNKTELESLANVFGRDKIALIYDGIEWPSLDQGFARKAFRDEFHLNQEFCVGLLARITEGKGHDVFVRCAALVLQVERNVRFFIVGDDPDHGRSLEKKIREMVRSLNIESAVIFTGWRNDRYKIICGLDVVVQASTDYPEGAPLVCCEAMACSKPVVATALPGSVEMVVPNVTGFLVPPKSPEAMAKAIIELKRSPETARKFGVMGCRRAEQYFDIKKNVKEVEALYLSI